MRVLAKRQGLGAGGADMTAFEFGQSQTADQRR
jgi:hypothetical protein